METMILLLKILLGLIAFLVFLACFWAIGRTIGRGIEKEKMRPDCLIPAKDPQDVPNVYVAIAYVIVLAVILLTFLFLKVAR